MTSLSRCQSCRELLTSGVAKRKIKRRQIFPCLSILSFPPFPFPTVTSPILRSRAPQLGAWGALYASSAGPERYLLHLGWKTKNFWWEQFHVHIHEKYPQIWQINGLKGNVPQNKRRQLPPLASYWLRQCCWHCSCLGWICAAVRLLEEEQERQLRDLQALEHEVNIANQTTELELLKKRLDDLGKEADVATPVSSVTSSTVCLPISINNSDVVTIVKPVDYMLHFIGTGRPSQVASFS